MVSNSILFILLIFSLKVFGIEEINNSQCQTFTIIPSGCKHKKSLSLPYDHVLFRSMSNLENFLDNNIGTWSFDKFCFLLKVLEGKKNLKFVFRRRKLIKLLYLANQLGLNDIENKLVQRCENFIFDYKPDAKISCKMLKDARIICYNALRKQIKLLSGV